MPATRSSARENEVAAIIVDCAYHIHRELGPGLLESVYESVLEHELLKRGLGVDRQQGIPIEWDGLLFAEGYRCDLVVEDLVVVEIKSVIELAPVRPMQLLTYIKLADKRLGLLINFNVALIKDGIRRIVNNL